MFSCFGSVESFSIGASNIPSIWSMDDLTLNTVGHVVILWSAFPHIEHKFFSHCQFTSSGLSLPSGPRKWSCGHGGHWLLCQLKFGVCWGVGNDRMGDQKPMVHGAGGAVLNSFLGVNLLSSICSQYRMS